ncbi:hypothetical protein RhiXN_02357 [Rhizoctonia solani]|uniref:Uncharacterized protein n=1 Tax=Rhizoctonia solani TaxID=456999 RepID=A0A8H8T4K3_9AGAM|nr:uncharacterized protein RhiXN_02357 [Rhizoctonia solani]QRW27762.1 hypothetical protein RhiXN_02357 [Rhizoctonia solani]
MPTNKHKSQSRRFDPTRYVAAVMYRYALAPTIRAIGASSRSQPKLLSFIPNKRQPIQVVLDFPLDSNWDSGAPHEWYTGQPEKIFYSLEYRKEKSGVRHEFIDAGRINAPLEEGTKSKDTARIIKTDDDQKEHKDTPTCCLINLFIYNCYFFSWTITALLAARRAVDWDGFAQSEETWATIVNDSLKHLAPASLNRSKASTGKRFLARVSKIGKFVGFKPKPSLPDAPMFHSLVDGAESHQEKFSSLLRKPLIELRETIRLSIRNLLLRSQLASTLEEQIDKDVRDAATQVISLSAVRAAGEMAMRVITALHPAKPESLVYAGLEWSDHCDIAWDVTCAAAAAAESAKAAPADGWVQEWDRVWQLQWDAKITAGDGDQNRPIGQNACRQARAAWRREWDHMHSVREEHISQIVNSMQEGILAKIPDLDDDRLKIGERAKANVVKRLFIDKKAQVQNEVPQPPLQEYIESRIVKHCETVQNFGFASYEDGLEKIESAMHQIWIKTVEALPDKNSK